MGQLMSRKVGCCAPPNQSFNASGFNRRMADDEDSRRCAHYRDAVGRMWIGGHHVNVQWSMPDMPWGVLTNPIFPQLPPGERLYRQQNALLQGSRSPGFCPWKHLATLRLSPVRLATATAAAATECQRVPQICPSVLLCGAVQGSPSPQRAADCAVKGPKSSIDFGIGRAVCGHIDVTWQRHVAWVVGVRIVRQPSVSSIDVILRCQQPFVLPERACRRSTNDASCLALGPLTLPRSVEQHWEEPEAFRSA